MFEMMRLMMTAKAAAALKQLRVWARIGGYDLRKWAFSAGSDSAEPCFGGPLNSVPSTRTGRHCSCSSGSSSEGNPQS